MDNELIHQKKRFSWKWFLLIAAVVLACIGTALISSQINATKEEREAGEVFDQSKWNEKSDDNFDNRNKMIKDLMQSGKLKKVKKNEVIALLGEPDRSDGAYLFYRVSQQRLGFFTLHATTLVIKISENGNSIMIHE
ncbi:MAG: hypothetical protein EOO48_09315 [Flavobacterium sp.]|nr:MAG: hypothetical protein EOO48_09315 [Flavobacterium sp.]